MEVLNKHKTIKNNNNTILQWVEGFEIAEPDLFQLMKLRVKDLKMGPCEYDSFDCHSEKHNYTFELKCRNVVYEGHLIERGKYDALMEIPGEVFYVVCDPRGTFVHKLKRGVEPPWEMELQPQTTQVGGSSDGATILKEVGYLDSRHAVKWF